MIKNKEEIVEWLTEHNIQNFEIIDDLFYGYLVNVNESVSLSKKSLKMTFLLFCNLLKSK